MKTKRETFKTINMNELEILIRKCTPFITYCYEGSAIHGTTNEQTCIELIVHRMEDLGQADQKLIHDNWKLAAKLPLKLILCKLASQFDLEPGKYLIRL